MKRCQYQTRKAHSIHKSSGGFCDSDIFSSLVTKECQCRNQNTGLFHCVIPILRLLYAPDFVLTHAFCAFSPFRDRLIKPVKPGIDKKTSHKRIFFPRRCLHLVIRPIINRPSPQQAAHRHAPVAQLDRAPDYESGGQRFESFRLRHSLLYINRCL